MLYISDLAVDDSDDLIIEGGDFALEEDGYKACIRVAEARANAREDTFMLDDINAGLEQVINKNIDTARNDVIFELTRVLKANSLFSNSDFDIKTNTDEKVLQVFVKINNGMTESNGFRVIIDQQNQNSYRS